uniref:Putative 5.3 kDa protein n=1 Tax=Ixodes ricinus TaxID=34613 RepID=A0A6B0TZG9_IXORI
MRATTLYLMAVSLLVTANLVRTCWRANDAYYNAAEIYCGKTCSSRRDCDWPCPYCVWKGYERRYRCKR